MNFGAFLVDPLLELMGFQRPTPSAPAAPTQAAPPLQLDMSVTPAAMATGNADGRPDRQKPGFLAPMLGQESPFKPGWSYSPGKGPQWVNSEPQKGPFTGNRI